METDDDIIWRGEGPFEGVVFRQRAVDLCREYRDRLDEDPQGDRSDLVARFAELNAFERLEAWAYLSHGDFERAKRVGELAQLILEIFPVSGLHTVSVGKLVSARLDHNRPDRLPALHEAFLSIPRDVLSKCNPHITLLTFVQWFNPCEAYPFLGLPSIIDILGPPDADVQVKIA